MGEDSDNFEITLKIAGKRHRVFKIPRDKEELYRRAERELIATEDSLRRKFAADNDEDYFAWAALQMAVNYVELEMKGNVDGEQMQLQQIEEQIDAYLKEI